MRRMPGGSFIFIIFLALMAFNSFQSGRFADPGQWLISVLLILPAIVVGVTFHEFMHAYSAFKLGDQTPKAQGRVTLNPLKHLDPVGLIVLIFIGFGWGRPVQVNPYAFKGNRRLAGLIVAVAGVLMNLFLAFCFSAVLVIIDLQYHGSFSSAPLYVFYVIVLQIVRINLILMLFNLLPVPPLDGFGIITEIFDLRKYQWYPQLYSNGMFILLILIIVPRIMGFDLLGKLLSPAWNQIPDFIYNIWLHILG